MARAKPIVKTYRAPLRTLENDDSTEVPRKEGGAAAGDGRKSETEGVSRKSSEVKLRTGNGTDVGLAFVGEPNRAST